jgi:hypothetical protein
MRHIFKALTSSVWLLLCVILASQAANAQKRYPPFEEAWDATDYRAMVERVEGNGLELPTLSGEATKPVFERMVAADNIPLLMGQNEELAITVRYQKLKPLLKPLHQLVIFYSNEAKNGKPYATELARLRVYETKAAGALLELGDPFLATLKMDPRYKTHVMLMDEMKSGARDVYAELVTSMAETSLYSKSDILVMIEGALNAIPSYHPVFTDGDRQDLTKALSQQISAASDQELKTNLTELHDAIQHGRIRT